MIGARTALACAVLSCLVSMRAISGQRGSDVPSAAVHVSYLGVRELPPTTLEGISQLALDLLRTSNFNSADHRDAFPDHVAFVHAQYRQAVSGSYLAVTFDRPQLVDTVGGQVTALEIVVGLNRPVYAGSLFTVDRQGRLIQHAKYHGEKAKELLEAIKQAVGAG